MKKPGQLSEELLGAMVATEPVTPMGFAIARDPQDRPLYAVCFVLGSENIERCAKAFKAMQKHCHEVGPDLDMPELAPPENHPDV